MVEFVSSYLQQKHRTYEYIVNNSVAWKCCTVLSRKHDANLHPVTGLQFRGFAGFRKLEYALAIVFPRSTLSWSGDAWQGSTYGLIK